MDVPSPTGRPAASSIGTTTRGARAEIRAVVLYALWAGLALLANTLGIATLPAGAGLILITGIGLTGALFVGLTRIPGDEQPLVHHKPQRKRKHLRFRPLLRLAGRLPGCRVNTHYLPEL